MKKVLFLLFFMVLLIGCKSTKSPIFKDLYLGMSYDEVLSKGFCGNRATEKMVTQLIKVTFLISQVYTTIRQNYILRIISWQKSLFIFQQKMHPNNKISLNL